jgi:hypothetical protein
MNPDFKNLKWLHDMGLALHWLHPRSKMPKGSNWQQGPRKSWKELKAAYVENDNVGVRTGQPSQFSDGTYLIILDIDVKSTDPQDAKAAYSAAETFLGRKLSKLPQVASGRGGASLHVYARCKSPKASFNLIRSPKLVKVLMPSIRPGQKEMDSLSDAEIKKGWRIRPAFEIDIYGTGKQAAIPPSVHPDTGKSYTWKTPIAEFSDIPIVSEDKFKSLNKKNVKAVSSVEFKEVDLPALKLSNKAVSLIESMEGLESYGGDRSAALFGVLAEMVLKNIDDATIVSVLSDPLNAISEVVIDRVGSDFGRAANWILPQIEKMRYNHSAENHFADTEQIELLADTDWAIIPENKAANQKALNEVGGWKLDLDRNSQGGYKMNLKNVSLYLRNICQIQEWLGHNLFTGEIEFLKAPPWDKKKKDIDYKGRMLTDADVVETRLYLSRKEKFEPTGFMALEGMISCAKNNSFHPVRDWLASLEWDGIERLNHWLHNYMGAVDSTYSQAVGRKMLLAAVTRVMRPGCKFDHVVILEGKQGIGKSTALRTLSSPWFCDSLGDVTNKDVIQQMQGSWLIEIGELASMDKASMNAFKDFITKQEDKARLAYQRLAQKFPRQCIFIGTTNDEEYLKDLTGNRRFWPVEIEVESKIEHEALNADKELLWAEAFELYKKDTEKLWLDDPKAKAEQEQIAGSKLVSDPLDELVEKYVAEIQKTGTPEDQFRDTLRVKISEIWQKAMNRHESSITRFDQMRIAGSLKRLGFHRKKSDGRMIWERF